MNSLIANKDNLFKIKRDILTDCLYNYSQSKKNEITIETISIVMTSSNRSKQTYFTLDSFLQNNFKNIQVILVDDSSIDPIDFEKLKEYPFTIDFISIKKECKYWLNPCINYNIGFKYVQGGKVIIQNAEVCHVGSVIDFVNTIKDDTYYIFDVIASKDYESNEKIYKDDVKTTNIYNKDYFGIWYQNSISSNRQLHFLTAMNRIVFNKIDGFSYDYAFGCGYDDDDLLLKISANNITKKSISHSDIKCGGIHLYHVLTEHAWGIKQELNTDLFNRKKHYLQNTGKYIELSDLLDNFDSNIKLL